MGQQWGDDWTTMERQWGGRVMKGRQWDNNGVTIFEGIGARLSWTITCPQIFRFSTALNFHTYTSHSFGYMAIAMVYIVER